jgi:hypothetical protein
MQKVRPGRQSELFIPTGVTDSEGKAIFITAGDVPKYFNEEFWSAYEFFAMTEILEVPPFSGGWTAWPAIAVSILFTLRAERNRCDKEEIEDKSQTTKRQPIGQRGNRG